MPRGIFLIRDDNSLTELREQRYESEALLQQLLAEHPSVLAGDGEDENPRRWLLIDREAGIPSESNGSPRWAVDHVFLDQEAIPTFVEVKRSTDTRIRREVVGQMLDYAANALAYWPPEQLRATFEQRCAREGKSPEQELRTMFGADLEPDSYWKSAKANLHASRIRLVFVADEIPLELRTVVEFLNKELQSTEVLAVEVRQYVGGSLRTLVPTVVGQTAEAQQRKNVLAAITQWDAARFLDALAERAGPQQGPKLVDLAQRILDWTAGRVSRLYWGKGERDGGFVPIVRRDGVDHQLFAVYTTGSLEVYFQYYAGKAPFSEETLRRELLRRLNTVPGVAIPDDAIARRPSIRLKEIAERGSLDQLLGVFDWFIDQLPR